MSLFRKTLESNFFNMVYLIFVLLEFDIQTSDLFVDRFCSTVDLKMIFY
jgi:hypothetical protein